MYKWSKKSSDLLATCDKRLQDLANAMLERSKFDLTIIEGYRTKDEQERAFQEGKSKAHYGQSKHNTFPSKAIDIAPYPISWDKNDIRWWKMIALAYEVARIKNIKIRSGVFFTGLEDYPHIEIID